MCRLHIDFHGVGSHTHDVLINEVKLEIRIGGQARIQWLSGVPLSIECLVSFDDLIGLLRQFVASVMFGCETPISVRKMYHNVLHHTFVFMIKNVAVKHKLPNKTTVPCSHANDV